MKDKREEKKTKKKNMSTNLSIINLFILLTNINKICMHKFWFMKLNAKKITTNLY